MNVSDVLLIALGALVVGSALSVVTSANVVRAGLWLVVALGAIAGCFLVLTAELVAWVQLLIYVGSVVVLLLFVTMLTRAPTGRSLDLDRPRLPAVLVGIATAATLGTLVVQAFGDAYVELDSVGSAERVGAAIFSNWVLGFELLSVILLAALIGTIVISRRSDGR
ncbi:MAG: NADH-quinone oxidoreductase subunit J family protein [Pseudonocardiaceae bacterium]